MTSSRNPTNGDLLKEIREVKAMQTTQDGRISHLESWKIAEDAYRAALKAVRGEEATDKRTQQDAQLKSTAIKVLTQLSPVLTAVGILLYALSQGVGK